MQDVRIAVACDKGKVSGHFGHCEVFAIYDVENADITKSESVANPGHRPGFLPNFLNGLGINVIISGGMGAGAVDLFNGHGIEVITGVAGDPKAAVESYLGGELKSAGSVCHEHLHSDRCESR